MQGQKIDYKQMGRAKAPSRVCATPEGKPICLHFNICTLQQAIHPLLTGWKAGKAPINPLHLAEICADYLTGPVLETEEERVLLQDSSSEEAQQ